MHKSTRHEHTENVLAVSQHSHADLPVHEKYWCSSSSKTFVSYLRGVASYC